MKKEPAHNLDQEPAIESPVGMTKWEARLVFCGVASAMTNRSMINEAVLESLDEAAKVLNIKNEADDNLKPPKPPRRPNLPVGRIALNY